MTVSFHEPKKNKFAYNHSPIMKFFYLLFLLLSSLFTQAQSPSSQLKVMMVFAHPDEGEVYSGGITALYTQLGHKVKFVSLTNGDAGHFSMKPDELAKRRYMEAMNAKDILKLAEYEILDYHDGILKNTVAIQQEVANIIDNWDADIVFTFFPAKGGHNDNMTAGYIVRDAVRLLKNEKKPVFMYIRDFHTTSFSYIPDIAIPIDKVWDIKLKGLGAHVSQVMEANPYRMGTYEEVKVSKKLQDEYLYTNAYDWSHITPEILKALEYWYGINKAQRVKYVEAYEFSEFGRQITKEEVKVFFPMINE